MNWKAMNEATERAGWDTESQVLLLMQYVENQQSPEAFEDFITRAADEQVAETAVYTSFENGGEEKEGMTREEVEADYASAAQNYVDNKDWGTVEDENGLACRLIMSCELVEVAEKKIIRRLAADAGIDLNQDQGRLFT
jgi:hypothetical protein